MSRSGVVDLTSDSNDEPHRRRYSRTGQLPSPFIEASRQSLGAKIVDLTAEDEEDEKPGIPASMPTASRPKVPDRLPPQEIQETPQENRPRKETSSPVSAVKPTLQHKPDLDASVNDQYSKLASNFQNTFTSINTPTVVRPRAVPETPPFGESEQSTAHLESTTDGDKELHSSVPQRRETSDPVKQPECSQWELADALQHLNTAQDDQERVDAIPLSLQAFEESLKRALCDLREDHQDHVKWRLAEARQLHGLTELTNVNRNSTFPSSLRDGDLDGSRRFIQSVSPFPRLGVSRRGAQKVTKKRGRLDQKVLKVGKPGIEKLVTDCVAYTVGGTSVPPYTNYVSTRRNVLIEDDKHRTFIPWNGDDTSIDADYQELENTIVGNQRNYHYLNAVAEKAKQYGSYTEKFLGEIGCDIGDVLRYLLDESNPTIPEVLPTELESVWLNREAHVEEDYYDDSDDSDFTGTDKQSHDRVRQPRKEWQLVFDSIPPSTDSRRSAAAGLACTAFLSVTGFSLWHVVKRHRLVSRAICGKTKSDESDGSKPNTPVGLRGHGTQLNGLETYTDLVCLGCFAHECPGHGEFNDEDDQKNVRLRLNAKPLCPPAADNRSMANGDDPNQIQVDISKIENALGRNEDGTVSGQALLTISDLDSVFKDDEFCSDSCFWLKANRSRSVSDFTAEDMGLLHTLLPAYRGNRRGACMLALAIDKPCVEIFLKICQIPTEYISAKVKLRNNESVLSHRPPPKHNGDYWIQNSITWKHDKRPPFRPCNHTGPCSAATDCSCFEDDVTCERTCMCASNCSRRFQGCTCAAKGKACWENERCDCFRLHRECDPDLCRSCGAREVLDPANRYRPDIAEGKCVNVYVQRGVPRRTLLGHSALLSRGGLSGWGLYMGEPIKKGDYIGEYVGEVVSREEGERRGLIYDKRNLSYLFDLNITQTLDSTRVGNKFRYINHQADPHANCRAKILLCNQVHRIGMFACQNMSVGDEILFDYGETFTSRFDLIKLDGNKQPKLERKRIGDVKKVPAANGKVTAKKSGGQIGRPRKKVMLDPDFKSHRSSHQSPSKDEDEILPDFDDVEPVKVSRKRRRSALDVDLDAGNEMADIPFLEEGVWELSSSESYHESEEEDEISEEEEEEEEEDEEEEMDDTTTPPPYVEEVEQRVRQQHGWDTRYGSVAKRPAQTISRPEVVGVKHEIPQKRGSKTRQDRQAKEQAQGQIIQTARKSSGRGILD